MSLSLISAPAVEPLSLSEAKSWIKVDGVDDDTVIQALITSARIAVESATNRFLITQQWRLTLDRWPSNGFLRLPFAPVRSISRIRLFDSSGVGTDVAMTSINLDANFDHARLVWSLAPQSPGAVACGIQIDLTVGYGDASAVPEPLRLAMRGLIAQWYADRGDGDAASSRMPAGVTSLLAPWRIRRLA